MKSKYNSIIENLSIKEMYDNIFGAAILWYQIVMEAEKDIVRDKKR